MECTKPSSKIILISLIVKKKVRTVIYQSEKDEKELYNICQGYAIHATKESVNNSYGSAG
jgi:hypothetical protein